MPRYYIHLAHEGHIVWDYSGMELPSLKGARGMEAAAAKEQWSNALRSLEGRPESTAVITDDAGRILFMISV
ncbi:DUF6894 family protein [Microvirga lenta]|uniref:DUF6894 family protein n=1 Tax=Microvirga lenta TaxID=2881337 RepID=UPI001CFFF3CE|nr:hypothetical protein [Microvirga lenta]MCB5176730.1 hypothetical protein [Microvirga lenta]